MTAEKPTFDSEGYQTNIKDLNGTPLPDLTGLEFKPLKHGGRRAGAGRKPSGRNPLLLRLSPNVIAALRKEAARRRLSISEVAEQKLKRSR